MLNALVTHLAAEGEAPKNPILPEVYDLVWSGLFFLVILF
ncbi:MAG: F0F1 ATP synthase subunit B, partial [Microbacterium sp. 14-71-5]